MTTSALSMRRTLCSALELQGCLCLPDSGLLAECETGLQQNEVGLEARSPSLDLDTHQVTASCCLKMSSSAYRSSAEHIF